tara:strand:- start:68 stop:973 length:906 start_codon:yes stop_codon:yes gene_type:complete
MAAKKGKAPTRSTEVVPRGYASQEGADVDLAPAELTAAQLARRRSDRARAESAGVLGPLRAEDLDIAPDVDVDALEDDRRKRESWERKKRQMAAQKAKRLASQGRIPPMSDHLDQVIQGIFGAADEREPVSAEDESFLRTQDRIVAGWEGAPDPYGDDEPLSPMTEFENRHLAWAEKILSKNEEDRRKAEELKRSMEEQPITQEEDGEAREEVSRDFMEDYPDLEDSALAIESEDDSAPRFATQIDTATDINEEALPDGRTEIIFTDNSGQKRRWVYDGNDDTLIDSTGRILPTKPFRIRD